DALRGKSNDAVLGFTFKGQSWTLQIEEMAFKGYEYKQSSDDSCELSLRFLRSIGKKGGTRTTLDYVQPAVSSTVGVRGRTTVGLRLGQSHWVDGGGVYLVTAVPDTTNVTLQNTGATGNATPGQTVNAGAAVSFDGADQEPLIIGKSDPIAKEGMRIVQI